MSRQIGPRPVGSIEVLHAIENLDGIPASPVLPVEPERPAVGGGRDVQAGLGDIARRLTGSLHSSSMGTDHKSRSCCVPVQRASRHEAIVLDRTVDPADERLATRRLLRKGGKREGPGRQTGPAVAQFEGKIQPVGPGASRMDDPERSLVNAKRRESGDPVVGGSATRDGRPEGQALDGLFCGVDDDHGADRVIALAQDEIGQRRVPWIESDRFGRLRQADIQPRNGSCGGVFSWVSDSLQLIENQCFPILKSNCGAVGICLTFRMRLF